MNIIREGGQLKNSKSNTYHGDTEARERMGIAVIARDRKGNLTTAMRAHGRKTDRTRVGIGRERVLVRDRQDSEAWGHRWLRLPLQ
jgi:hypothetical protein